MEGGSADEAYIKSNVQNHLNDQLNIPQKSSWIPFQSDIPHQINLCDEEAKKLFGKKLWMRSSL